MGKRELVSLLCLSSWWLVIVVWLFLTMPWVCLQFVIVVFPDHSHLLFLKRFIITVIGAVNLIWKSLDQFLKIAIHRGISVFETQFWCILIIVTQIIHLISIFVYIYTRHKYCLKYSVVRLRRHYSQPVT